MVQPLESPDRQQLPCGRGSFQCSQLALRDELSYEILARLVAILLYIALGGAVGAVSRYLVSGWVMHSTGRVFPVGTLCVNVIGCLLIGILGAAFAGPQLIREEYRLALMVGLLGSFTTFSTFGAESMALVSAGQLRLAVLNVVLSNGLGLSAAWFGYRAGERWFGV